MTVMLLFLIRILRLSHVTHVRNKYGRILPSHVYKEIYFRPEFFNKIIKECNENRSSKRQSWEKFNLLHSSKSSNTQKLLEKVSRLSSTTYYRHHAGFLLERKISIKTTTLAYNTNWTFKLRFLRRTIAYLFHRNFSAQKSKEETFN